MSDAEMLFDCIDKVRTFFKNEPDKAIFWFETENLNFGGFSPMALQIENFRALYRDSKLSQEDKDLKLASHLIKVAEELLEMSPPIIEELSNKLLPSGELSYEVRGWDKE